MVILFKIVIRPGVGRKTGVITEVRAVVKPVESVAQILVAVVVIGLSLKIVEVYESKE
jgi:hypothetical protein